MNKLNDPKISLKESSNYTEELAKVFDSTSNTSSRITYYFNDRDTNPLKNVLVTKIKCDEITHYHKHDFFEINYVLSGVLHQNIGGKNFTLNEGDLLFMSPGVYHACVPETNSDCLNILFKKDYIKKLADEFKDYNPDNYLSHLAENTIYTTVSSKEPINEISQSIVRIFESSSNLVHHSDLYENLAIENVAAGLLLSLTKLPRHEFDFESGKRDRRESITPDDIARYISDNFDKINLSDTALHFGYSSCQLHRILKKHTGHTFSELVLSIRMQRARHYLLNTHLPIKNIAYLLGIDSAEHFSRMFTKHRGMTPKEYRKTYMHKSLLNQ